MTPSFIQMPAAQPPEPPEDLEIVRRIYEIQKELLKSTIDAKISFKRALQHMLLAMSFLAILLGYFLQTFVSYYLQTYIAKLSFEFNPNSLFGLLLTVLIFLCVIFWGITTGLSVYGLFKPEEFWYPGYEDIAHVELDLRINVYNTFKWYTESIINLQDLIELMQPATITEKVTENARWSLGITIIIFVITFAFIIFTLPLSLPLSQA